ncbi:MAG: helix-turn-helix domain-containing protein [Prevotella sp.]|nr:helix-turn-helix domain-containing protein [Staphylococcus sp.]MCM1349923.1 helix-turn-helix domain-containing protein [Prevotella sp.]
MLKNNIKFLRKEQKITIRDLEEKVHINRTTLSRMENGLQNISDEYLHTLSNFFNVSTDYLLGLSDIRNPEKELNKQQESDPIFFSLYDEVKELTEEQKEEILDIIKKLKAFKK